MAPPGRGIEEVARGGSAALHLGMSLEPLELEPDLLDRLTDPADPALRARVLADLLDRAVDDPELLEAHSRIQEQPWIGATIAAQHGDGSWGRGLCSGYDGTIWVLYHLSEVGAPPDLDPIQMGLDTLLAAAKSVSGLRGRRALIFEGCPNGVYWEFPTACFTAHAATALIRFGRLSHGVTQAALGSCRALFDSEEGFHCFVMDDSLLPACFMAVPAVLKAFLSIPEPERSAEDRDVTVRMVRLLRKRHLYRYVAKDNRAWREWGDKATARQRREESPKWLAAGRADPRREKAGWLRFSFPHSYNSDLLDVVLLLGEAGADFDEVVEDGLRIILSKRGTDGMWRMVGGLNGKMHSDLDRKGEPSPWITYRALLAFKHFGLLKT
ncbi:hypothetical protein ACFL3S_00235 [Gemmatimonadota bacterium]